MFVSSNIGDRRTFAVSSLLYGLLPYNLSSPFLFYYNHEMTESIIALLFFLDIISFVYMIEPKSLAQFSVHSYSITIMSTFFFSLHAICIYLQCALQSIIIYIDDANRFADIYPLFIVFSLVALLTLLRFVRLLPLRLLFHLFLSLWYIRWLSNKRCSVNVANIRHANSYNACLCIFFHFCSQTIFQQHLQILNCPWRRKKKEYNR